MRRPPYLLFRQYRHRNGRSRDPAARRRKTAQFRPAYGRQRPVRRRGIGAGDAASTDASGSPVAVPRIGVAAGKAQKSPQCGPHGKAGLAETGWHPPRQEDSPDRKCAESGSHFGIPDGGNPAHGNHGKQKLRPAPMEVPAVRFAAREEAAAQSSRRNLGSPIRLSQSHPT